MKETLSTFAVLFAVALLAPSASKAQDSTVYEYETGSPRNVEVENVYVGDVHVEDNARRINHGTRFRFGVDIGAGFAPKDDLGLLITALPNFGVQFNDVLGLVAMTGVTMGGFTNRAADAFSDDQFAQFNGIGLLDITLGSGLQIGGGGGVDVGDFGVCAGDSQTCAIERHTAGAVHGRLALTPGFRTPRGRMGFPISAQYHAPFIDGKPIHKLLFTIGFQRF